MSGVPYAATGVAVIVIGDTLNQKSIDMKKILAGGVVTLSIAALDNVNDLLSTRFGQLFLLGVAFLYAVPLINNLGLGGNSSVAHLSNPPKKVLQSK